MTITGFENLNNFTRNRSVLVVDDDPGAAKLFSKLLSPFFSRVVTAAEGHEGIKMFGDGKFDLIITDQLMPKMTGLEMVREIRRKDSVVPVILITGNIESDVLAEAINLGVNQFLPKPLNIQNMLTAIENALQRVILDEQKEQVRKMELMKEKEKYRDLQEKLSFDRQLVAIRNDLYYRALQIDRPTGSDEWFINICFRPHDILSGDSYSIRLINKSAVFAFILDAMGKGVSASLTATHTTSVINHLVDRARDNNSFSLRPVLTDFLGFVTRDLLAEEMISAAFLYLDLENETIDAALFSMPPVYMETTSGRLVKINSNNMPIGNFTEDFSIDKYEIPDVNKIMFSSDGLLSTNYMRQIESDFMSSILKGTFDRKFQDKVNEISDDTTYIIFRRITAVPEWEKAFSVKGRLAEIARLSQEIEECLSEKGLEWGFIIELMNAFSEIIMNAYEHGTLNVDPVEKRRLMSSGDYEEHLMKMEQDFSGLIHVDMALYREKEESYIMLKVRDQGAGFNPVLIKEYIRNPELVFGKGIKMVKHLVDEIHYNGKGNEAILIKKV